ncbi:MAG: hypothetical protein ACFFBD_28140 [Candidatus Hodarchaeota archaeon]
MARYLYFGDFTMIDSDGKEVEAIGAVSILGIRRVSVKAVMHNGKQAWVSGPIAIPNVPAGWTYAHACLAGFDFQFGHQDMSHPGTGDIDDHHLGYIQIYGAVLKNSSLGAALHCHALLRDKNGDDKWKVSATFIIFFYK